MGNAGSTYGRFQRALSSGSYLSARAAAHDLPYVALGDALRLTMLAADKETRERYEALARRWLERFLAEGDPTLKLARWTTEDLDNVGDPECPFFLKQESEGRLRRLLERL